jgi:hypothetical protein
MGLLRQGIIYQAVLHGDVLSFAERIDVPFTQEEGEVVDGLIAYARDNDHDDLSGEGHWLSFLVDEGAGQTVDQVRDLLDSAYGKASCGVTLQDMREAEELMDALLETREAEGVSLTPEARAAVERLLDREVYIVITPDDLADPRDWHIEVLDELPKWNWLGLGQFVVVANVNGGDSQIVHPQPGTAERADVTLRLANAFGYEVPTEQLGTEKALLDVFGYITGIVNEYRDGGDQMVESTCICQVSPGGHRILNPVCPNHGIDS